MMNLYKEFFEKASVGYCIVKITAKDVITIVKTNYRFKELTELDEQKIKTDLPYDFHNLLKGLINNNETKVDSFFKNLNKVLRFEILFRHENEIGISVKEIENIESRYKLMLKNIPDILVITNEQGVQKYVSEAAKKITGYKAEELKGKLLSEIIHPEDMEQVLEVWKESLRNPHKVLSVQYRHIHKTKKWVLLEAIGQNFINEPAIQGIITIVRDISKRKASELALEQTEEKFRLIAEHSPDSIMLFKKDKLEYASPVFYDVMGYKPNEFKNATQYDFINLVHPEDRPELIKNYENAVKNKTEYEDYQYRIKKKNGDYIWVHHFASRKFNIAGELDLTVAINRDVTNQVKIEEALRLSEEKFSKMGDNALDSVILINHLGNIEYWDPAAEKMFGYKAKEVHGKDVHQLIMPPKYALRFKTAWEKFSKTGKGSAIGKVYELFAKNASNKEFPVEISLSSMKISGNYWAAAYIRDISERKETEKKLLKQKEQFELAVSGTNDGIFDWDILTNNLFLSKRWKQMLGYEDHELKNEFATFQNLIYEDDFDRVFSFVNKYLAGEVKVYEIDFRMKHKDGSLRWITAKGEAIRDKYGRPVRMAGSHSDITERRKIKEQLIHKSNLLESVLNAMPGTLNVVDKEFNVIAFNQTDYRMKLLGDISPDAVIGNKCHKVFMKRNKPCPWCNVKKVLETGKSYEETTTPDDPREQKTGRALHIMLSPVFDEHKNVTGVVEYGIDVTELRNAKTKAEAANKAKSDFLANMSHEIRTPLNSIIGYSDLLSRSNLDATQSKFIDSVKNSSKALLDVISDILDFSKIETGKLELDIVKTDIILLFEEILDILKFAANKSGIELLLNINPKIPRYVYIDPIRFKQVVINLAGNAIKFTDKGEVEITVDYKIISKSKENLKVTVRDTGIGIPQNSQHKLFKAFSQVDTSATRRFGGTGLGLVISNKLVQKMDGKMSFESTEGVGSVFGFEINANYAFGKSFIKNINNIKNVLVADDNKASRNILKRMIESWGINVTSCNSGHEAENILASQNDIELIIIDYGMPEIDGIEIIQKIRKYGNTLVNKLPIIMLHYHSEEKEIRERSIGLKIDSYVEKPIKESVLNHAINKITPTKYNDKVNTFTNKNETKKSTDSMSASILLVEDNPSNMTLLKTMLDIIAPKLTIYEAETGEEAFTIFKKKSFDLVLMDIQMPGMSGIDATILIRKYEKEHNKLETPIYALTARAMKGEKEKCLGSGMTGFMAKPLKYELLEEVIAKYSTP